jgi:hypothetical protein
MAGDSFSSANIHSVSIKTHKGINKNIFFITFLLIDLSVTVYFSSLQNRPLCRKMHFKKILFLAQNIPVVL